MELLTRATFEKRRDAREETSFFLFVEMSPSFSTGCSNAREQQTPFTERGKLIAPFHACIIRLHASNGGVISSTQDENIVFIYSMKAKLLGLSCSIENYWKIIFFVNRRMENFFKFLKFFFANRQLWKETFGVVMWKRVSKRDLIYASRIDYGNCNPKIFPASAETSLIIF